MNDKRWWGMAERWDMSLTVHEELPPGVNERIRFHSHLKEAWGMAITGVEPDGVTFIQEFMEFHYCPKCNGWIKGHVQTKQVNNLGLLSGRKGRASYCRRCGYEIEFEGIVS